MTPNSRSYLNRFLSPDSIISDPYNSLDYDRYSYARNNPIKYTDPTGHAVACGTDSGNGCSGTGTGGLTPSEIIAVEDDPYLQAMGVYNYSVTHPDYNYALDDSLEDTSKVIVASAIFLGTNENIKRQVSLLDRIMKSGPAFASGAGLAIMGIVAGGGKAKGGVYTITNPSGQVVRVGHTKNLISRRGNYGRDPNFFDLDFNIEHEIDDYATRRGLEQMLYDDFHPPLNINRPIAVKNPNFERYMQAAKRFLQDLLGQK